MRVAVEAHTGSQLTSVVWRDERGEQPLAASDDPADPYDPPGRSWQALVPTADLPDGPHRGTVTATDSLGRSSTTDLGFTVIHSLTVTPTRPWPAAVDDLALQRIDLSYRYAAAVRDAYPVSAVIRVDGTSAAVDRQLDLDEVAPENNAGTATVTTGYRLSPGPHQVELTIIDNRTVTRTLSFTLTVAPTLTATWLEGANGTVVHGELHRLRARVLTTAGADVSPQDELAPTTVMMIFVLSRGTNASLSTTVRVLPRLTARMTEAYATAGRPFTLAGEVTGTARIPGGVKVDLQTRAGTSWTTIGTATTQQGVPEVRLTVTAARSTDYRLVPRPQAGAWGSSPGPVRHVNVVSTLTVTKKPQSARKSKKFTVHATTMPADTGAYVELHRYLPSDRSWVSVAHAVSTKGGLLELTYRSSATATFRLHRPGTGNALAGTSSSFTVKITK